MLKRLVLIVKVTHACNMNCIYCYDREKRDKQKHPMSIEGVETILKTFNGKYEHIHWIWHGGEPLLMDSEKFYKYFYEEIFPKYSNKGTEYEFSIQTNLTPLTLQHIDWIKKYKVSVGTSFDGIHNNEFRIGGQKWEEKALLFNKEVFGSGLSLGVGITVTPKVADTLKETHEYLKKYTNYPVYTPVYGWQSSLDNTKQILNGLEDFLYYLLTETNDEIPRPYEMLLHYLMDEEFGFCENSGCLGHWFAIDPNMDVYPCGRHWPEEYKLGNLTQNSIKEILKSNAFIYLKSVDKHLSDKCIECTLLDFCRGGCYNSRLAQMGTLEKHDPLACYYLQELHKMMTNAFFNNFDKITNKTFLNKYGEKIQNILKNNGGK